MYLVHSTMYMISIVALLCIYTAYKSIRMPEPKTIRTLANKHAEKHAETPDGEAR